MLTFTRYASVYHTRGGVLIQAPWSEMVPMFLKHEVRGSLADSGSKDALDEAKNGPALVLGEMDTPQPRKANHMVACHAVGLDFDGCPEPVMEKAINALAPFTHVVYTTHKSGSLAVGGMMRLRVIVPLSTPVPPDDYARVWAYLASLTGWIVDLDAKDPSRLHYLPTTFDPSQAKSYAHDALLLDPATLPATVAHPEALERGRKALRYLRGDYQPAAKAVLHGKAFAAPGDRHTTQRGLTMRLAQKTAQTPLDDHTVTTLFARSVALMQAQDPSSPGIEAIITSYRGALERIQGEMDTAQHGAEGPYTPEELQEIGIPLDSHLWIVQKGPSYYFRTPRGYRGPFTKEEFGPAARDHLGRSPARLVEARADGTPRHRSPAEVTMDHGTAADRVIVDLTIEQSTYDPATGTLREASLRKNPHLEPQHHPQVDEWLRIVAGPAAETLLDWLACVPHLDRMLSALYLAGPPGTGKGLIAESLACIWAGTSVDVSRLLSDFNEELVRCPIVFGDENLPASWKGMPITAKLRSEIGSTVRQLSRKYLAPSEIHGNIRLILAANRDDLLKSKEALTKDDAQAIAKRFLYLHLPLESERFLLSLTHDERNRWKTTKIPEHVLHLAQTREVEPQGRFWVEGSVSMMTDVLMTSSDWNSRVCEWLVEYLTLSNRVDAKQDGRVLLRDGKLLVNIRAITTGWNIYFPDTRLEADTRAIADALRSIAHGQVRARSGKHQRQYFDIKLDLLWSWAERNGVGGVEEMQQRLTPTD